MVLVDTTVWIDFLGDKPTLEVAELERLLNEGEDVCTCGIILTEVLQGIRDDVSYRKTLSFFDDLLYLPMNRDVFVMSAQLYRSLTAPRSSHTQTGGLHDCLSGYYSWCSIASQRQGF